MTNLIKFPKKPVRKPPQIDPQEWDMLKRQHRQRVVDVVLTCVLCTAGAALFVWMIVTSY